MIYFGYPKLTFNISMATFARIVAYEYVQCKFHPCFLLRCFYSTVLLKQSAYRNRGLFLGRYCDISS